jgi:transcriptional regulator with XRE-family HTH domain
METHESEFADWLAEQLGKQGWSQSELARRSGVTPAGVSQVLSGKADPGPDFCNGIARALGIPPERVFRQAGLLPELHQPDPDLEDFIAIIKHLPDEELDRLLAIAETLYQIHLERTEKENELN